MKQKLGPSDHARFSPSAADKWTNCPAWYKLTKDKPRTSNASADEGTKRHEAAAETLLALTAEVTEGKEASIKDIDEEDLNGYVLPIVHWLKEDPVNRKVYVEAELKPSSQTDPDCWGTCDAYGIDTELCELHVWDLKTGHNSVIVERNLQLSIYAILIQILHGIDAFNQYTVFLHICQGGEVYTWEAPDRWLCDLELRIDISVLVAKDENPKANPGTWCKYCAASTDCPARRTEVAKVESAILSEPLQSEKIALNDKDSEYLAGILDLSDRIEDFITDVRAEVLRRGGVPGRYKTVEAATKRAWNDVDQEAIITILRSKGVQAPTVQKLITLGDAEKALIKAGQPKAIAKRVIESLTIKGRGKLTLAPWSDKRPAITQQDEDISP